MEIVKCQAFALRSGEEQEAKESPTRVIGVVCRIEAEIRKPKAKLEAKLGMRALKEEQELERKLE